VIRMDVAGLTQWGSSWARERTCGRGAIRKNCGNLWKVIAVTRNEQSQKPHTPSPRMPHPHNGAETTHRIQEC
jgi:hypothetical protein